MASNSGIVNSGQVLEQLEIKKNYENNLERSIQAMLERVFGFGRVIVRVTANLDFDYEELREKRSEPVVGSKGVVISEEIRTETFGVQMQVGFLALRPTFRYPAVAAAGESEYEKEEITRNYEISVSEKYRVKAPGEVRNLSIAVWIDAEELSDEERDRIAAMVSSAVGLRPER